MPYNTTNLPRANGFGQKARPGQANKRKPAQQFNKIWKQIYHMQIAQP